MGTVGTDGGLLSTGGQRPLGAGASTRRGLERDGSAWRSGGTFSGGTRTEEVSSRRASFPQPVEQGSGGCQKTGGRRKEIQ